MNALVTPFCPLDDLEHDLLDCWREVSQATFRFLVLLREFDLRQGWKEWGSADCTAGRSWAEIWAFTELSDG